MSELPDNTFSDQMRKERIDKILSESNIRKQDLALLASYGEYMKESFDELKFLWAFSTQEERQGIRLKMKKELKEHLEDNNG